MSDKSRDALLNMFIPELGMITLRDLLDEHGFVLADKDEIERLRALLAESEAERERLREALKPFAFLANRTPIMAGRGIHTRPRRPLNTDRFDFASEIRWGDIRAARDAITPAEGEE